MGMYDLGRLEQMALQIRRDTVRMVTAAGAGHAGGAMGAAEIFAALYGGVLRVDPKRPEDPDRDRLVLSNGHTCAGWYSALSLAGFLPREELATFRLLGSRPQGHPARGHLPGLVETSTGPLGQGFSVANGIALALRLDGRKSRVVCLVGDGEMQEGIVWESLMTAAQHRLDALTLVVLANNIQIDGEVSRIKALEPLRERLASFGWEAREVDGHDLAAVTGAFDAARPGAARPQAIVARTTIAKGVSFMEGSAASHGGSLSREQCAQALAELGTSTVFADYPAPPQRSGL
jgi:transketolase